MKNSIIIQWNKKHYLFYLINGSPYITEISKTVFETYRERNKLNTVYEVKLQSFHNQED